MVEYTAVPCPCGHPSCKSWLVSPVADVQGVSFTKEQAEAVADFLNRALEPDGKILHPALILSQKEEFWLENVERFWRDAPLSSTIPLLLSFLERSRSLGLIEARGDLERDLYDFLRRKYTQSADARQRKMGLQYTTAETHDLAREVVGFLSRRISSRGE